MQVQRLDLAELLEKNPSLKPYLNKALQKAYLKAVSLAVGEADLPDTSFPPECPYSLAEILSDRFFPGEPNKQ
ncbi:MAG: DUF29 domain-containing protein [Leptolyngbyaceae cyanobacterium HOT.MB2.61]|nr:DUF29 domain-containing protein [Leptolyngbyaceae cyanobacterium HOT.MB2.61]